MLRILLSPEDEAKLRERAAAAGQDVTQYVLRVVEADLAAADPAGADDAQARQPNPQWEQDFDAWVAGHPRPDCIADDSRQSVYSGRGQ